MKNSNCQFCEKFEERDKQFFVLNRALHYKYSSNTNYYSTNEINELIEDKRKTKYINFKQEIDFEDEDEYLKEYYNKIDGKDRLNKFLEFYKYHQEIPRFYMEKLSNIILKYHASKRQIHYNRVKKMLNINPSASKEKKKIISNLDKGDKMLDTYLKLEDKSVSQTLEDIIKDFDIEKIGSFNNEMKKNNLKNNNTTSKTKSNTRTLNLDLSVNLNEELEIGKFKKFLNNLVLKGNEKAPDFIEKLRITSKDPFYPKGLKGGSNLKSKKFSIRDNRNGATLSKDFESATFNKSNSNIPKIKTRMQISVDNKTGISGIRIKKLSVVPNNIPKFSTQPSNYTNSQKKYSSITSKRNTESRESFDNFQITNFKISTNTQIHSKHSRLNSQNNINLDFKSTKRTRGLYTKNINSNKSLKLIPGFEGISQKAKLQLSTNKGIYDRIKNQLFGQSTN